MAYDRFDYNRTDGNIVWSSDNDIYDNLSLSGDVSLVPNPLVDKDGDNTYEIVSKIAYLIGVPKRIFENEVEPPKIFFFNTLERDRSARIIRNLCVVRNAIEINFKKINDRMKFQMRSLQSLTEYIPAESLTQLTTDGVNFIKKSNTKLCQHIMEINRLIADRINNCQKLFPIWIKWEYIKDLFIMPNGFKEEGTKSASDTFYAFMAYYPYQVYINWKPRDEKNILQNDKKFVRLLYSWHNDYFREYNKVSDAGSYVKGNIYDFIESGEKTVVVVDCENSDPYKLTAVLKNLNHEYTQKISSLILFDDIHASTAWDILSDFIKIPVEHLVVERVKNNKSLVDIKLTARACQEHYQNSVDSFIIVSSDSDYWGLISSLPDARFLVMIERENCGQDLKKAMFDAGIFYCYIDDFYTGNADMIKNDALFKEMYRYIDCTVRLNINDMFNIALNNTRIEMSEAEKKQFKAKYLKTMQMSIGDSGDVLFEFKRK